MNPQREIPSQRESADRAEFIPAQGTHRLSLLPIECSGELFGLARC